jgi:DNA-binding beta-propeller fold protein YncE
MIYGGPRAPKEQKSLGARGMRVKTLGGMRMKAWVLGAVILFTVFVAGCGGNSTAVSVTVAGPSSATTGFPIAPNRSVQLAATVAGITATSVYWQVCLPPTLSTAQPTNCTPAAGPAQCKLPTVSIPLTGYGTVTPNGLYTAPADIPSPNVVLAVATSCVRSTAFGTFKLVIESQYSVKITPSTATIATGQTFQFNATVQGPTPSGVNWSVCVGASGGGLNCGGSGNGTISGSGAYTAPGTLPTGAVIIQATSVADPTQSATATVTVVQAAAPSIASIEPTIAAAGSTQQDVYISGANFLSTEQVFLGPAGQAGTPVPTTLLSTTLLRATIPATQLAAAGSMQLTVQTPDGSLVAPVPQTFTLFATRPALIAELPDSVSQGSSNTNVTLTGGFFSTSAANVTTATFNGASVLSALNSSRQLKITVPGSALQTEGLYPVVVQNANVAAGEPSMAGMNLAVTPTSGFISPGPVAGPIGVGSNPTSVAIDKADGIAVVANTGSNSVSLVSLQSNSVVGSIGVGNQPTGVAVDDQLPDPVALVVNSADQTVTGIDLTTGNTTTLSVSIGAGPNPSLPYAIGINPTTAQPVPGVTPVVHRALVAYQSANVASVLDVSDVAGTPVLSMVQTIGGTAILTFSTGVQPAIAVDPRLNWAVVTPGGSGTVGIIDLGRDPVPGVDIGRTPQLVASLAGSITIQGIGIDPETHEVFLSDPNATTGRLIVFNPLNNFETTVTNPCTGSPCTATPFNAANFGAAAVNPLDGVGVAVKDGNAVVVDLGSGIVLQNVTGLGRSPAAQAVAVDPVTNEAVVVNSQDGTVSILSLGGALNPMQIVQTSRTTTFTSSSPVSLTVTGSFATGSVVRLDQTALATTPVASTCTGSVCRQLTAVVPATMLGSARRYAVDVKDPALNVSNIEDFTVVQAIPVGNTPVAVAVDADRDLAVVTNSGDGTASLVSLSQSAASPGSLGPVGQLSYSPVQVGSTPEGVAVLSRLGVAIVANYGSNNATAIDETGTVIPSTISLCGASCVGPTGVAINPDTENAVVTNTNPGTPQLAGTMSTIALSPLAASSSGTVTVDPDPVAAAIDPILNYAAIATASQSSSVDIINLATQTKVGGITGVLQNPSGIIFDPFNQVFLTADSLQNAITIIDPNTFLPTSVAVGIGPTSLDYNYQTSTLVTVNGPSRTMSVMVYLCPPSSAAPTCIGPQVRSVLALGGSQNSATVLGPNAVAIDLKLNLAAVVDPDNNRLLLVPLPR